MWSMLVFAVGLAAQDLPKGQIVDGVKCQADPQQSYALYLPTNYNPDKPANLILAFDPAARGRMPVERYQAAAEKYGYIVMGSNNSRNGSMESSVAALRAMTADAGTRFAVDARRVYAAGMSGGARVAMMVALSSNGQIAGVIASSAGWPDSKPRKTVPFLVFGTAGTEDFNYLEMRQLDASLASTHHVAIFDGGHTWLPAELAMEAVEWLELHAMKSGVRAKDTLVVETLFARRVSAAAAERNELAHCRAMEALVADFQGMKDVASFAARASICRAQKPVKDQMKKDKADLDGEARLLTEIGTLRRALTDVDRRQQALPELREKLASLKKKSDGPMDTMERRQARRVLRNEAASAREVGGEAAFQKILTDLGITVRRGQ